MVEFWLAHRKALLARNLQEGLEYLYDLSPRPTPEFAGRAIAIVYSVCRRTTQEAS